MQSMSQLENLLQVFLEESELEENHLEKSYWVLQTRRGWREKQTSQLHPIKQNNLTRPICSGSDKDQTETQVWRGTKHRQEQTSLPFSLSSLRSCKWAQPPALSLLSCQ